jgi:hypothetical protein
MMFEKMPYLRNSYGLPGVFITGESLTNMNTFDIVSGYAFWDQEKLLDEKTGDEKSRNTVPLIRWHINVYT